MLIVILENIKLFVVYFPLASSYLIIIFFIGSLIGSKKRLGKIPIINTTIRSGTIMMISLGFKSRIVFSFSFSIIPKTILLYKYSIYIADRMIPVAVKKAINGLNLKAPKIIKNSPTKPLVPGKPIEARVNIMKATE